MTKRTIYIANDGTEFENKKECEHLDTPEVIFFDSVECFDLLVKAYNEFLTDEQFTDRVLTDNSKTGLWRYNGLEEYWEI